MDEALNPNAFLACASIVMAFRRYRNSFPRRRNGVPLCRNGVPALAAIAASRLRFAAILRPLPFLLSISTGSPLWKTIGRPRTDGRQPAMVRAIGSPGYGVAHPSGGRVLPDRPLPARRLRRFPAWRGASPGGVLAHERFCRGEPLQRGTTLTASSKPECRLMLFFSSRQGPAGPRQARRAWPRGAGGRVRNPGLGRGCPRPCGVGSAAVHGRARAYPVACPTRRFCARSRARNNEHRDPHHGHEIPVEP